MMLKCFNWLETRQTRRWYPPLTWMKMDDVFPLSFTVQKWRQNIGYKCYQEFIEVYFEFHLSDISGGSGLWSILQPTYRGQSRCFGSVFGKMSCYLFIYSHLFKDGLWWFVLRLKFEVHIETLHVKHFSCQCFKVKALKLGVSVHWNTRVPLIWNSNGECWFVCTAECSNFNRRNRLDHNHGFLLKYNCVT